jgi:hypothetical protein
MGGFEGKIAFDPGDYLIGKRLGVALRDSVDEEEAVFGLAGHTADPFVAQKEARGRGEDLYSARAAVRREKNSQLENVLRARILKSHG